VRDVYDILQDLASNNSRNYKIQVLQDNYNNNVLKTVIFNALDPFTQYYIKKIPEYKSRGNGCLMKAMRELFLLSNRDKTGNAGIEHLTQILSNLSPTNAKVIELIIAKDLKCGVSISTVNKVWTDLIKEYPVMLCSKFEQRLIDKMEWPAYVQMKMDGMRFNAIVQDGKVEYRSRNGKELNLLGYLDDTFIKMASVITATGSITVDCVFDGELLVEDENGLLDRQTGNGILSKAMKGTLSDKEASMIIATIWDFIPYMYFIDGYCPMDYLTRMNRIEYVDEKVRPVSFTKAFNIDDVNRIFQEYLAQGEEGIILKNANSYWEGKRVKHQIKFKGELDCDLKIVGVQPGTGKYEGQVGALICESSDGILKVNVGSGLTDENRETFKAEDIIGKIVAVRYNARIKNKDGDESLFLPVFIEVREDKDQADSNGDIK